MSKYIDMIGWDDTPHLKEPYTSQERLDELAKDYLPHQKKARQTGQPGLGAGAIYPVDIDALKVPPFAIPEFWPRGYALDVGWSRTAALFGAKDPDANRFYLTAEYYRAEQEPVVHAAGIKAMLPWEKQLGACDPAARGRSQRDGIKLINEYQDAGLNLCYANNAVHAGLHRVLTLMQEGRLFVFNTLVHWFTEIRLYRRDEKGNIVKENDHLMDDTRYLLLTDGLFTTRPVKREPRGGRGEF